MTTADVLREAARLVAKGWCQGAYEKTNDGQRCYCAEGAIIEASNAAPGRFRSAIFAAESHLAGAIADTAIDGSVLAFNDAPGRTQAEVVAALEAAAASVEAMT